MHFEQQRNHDFAEASPISRREMLRLAAASSLLTAAFFVGGCEETPEQREYREAVARLGVGDVESIGTALRNATKQFRPDWVAALDGNTKVADAPRSFEQNLADGENTLRLVVSLLKREAHITASWGRSEKAGPCLYIDGVSLEEFTAVPGKPSEEQNKAFEVIAGRAAWIRNQSVEELKACREAINREAKDFKKHANDVEPVLLAGLSTKLGILAERLESKILLVDNNILNHKYTYKGHLESAAVEVIGRTEHLEEALKELDQLRRIRKASTRPA